MTEDPARYGQTWAPVYDETHTYLDPTAAVHALHALAGDGPALELGIGTGRVAVPLAARGTTVHGIDASEAMIAQLRAKAGGVAIPVMLGDFTTVVRAERYAVVYIVFSTICGPLTQDGQIATFRNAAAHLAQAGCSSSRRSSPIRRASTTTRGSRSRASARGALF